MEAGKEIHNDIYAVSASLTAGVLIAAFAFRNAPRAALYIAAAVLSSLCWTGAGIAAFNIHRRRLPHPTVIAVLFLLTGAFCLVNRSIVLPGIGESGIFIFARECAAGISGTIRDIGFRDSEDNALLQALILGDRSRLSPGTTAAFRNAGAAHLLALSGMHLGIIYLILNKLLALAGNSIPARKSRSAIIVTLTGAYTLMCGCGPSLVRSWLFILLNESGRILGRPQKPGQVFCTALTLHLIFRPESIVNIGFQLSYLAMVGIVFLWPAARRIYAVADGDKGDDLDSDGSRTGSGTLGQKIWDGASLSICCQAFTAPLTLLYFGTFPKYFLITNLFAAPLMSVVMLCGLASLLTAASGADVPLLVNILEMPVSWLRALLGAISAL